MINSEQVKSAIVILCIVLTSNLAVGFLQNRLDKAEDEIVIETHKKCSYTYDGIDNSSAYLKITLDIDAGQNYDIYGKITDLDSGEVIKEEQLDSILITRVFHNRDDQPRRISVELYSTGKTSYSYYEEYDIAFCLPI